MTAFTLPLPTYQCHKQVQALRIKAMVPNPRGYELHFEDERFCQVPVLGIWVLARLHQWFGCEAKNGFFLDEDVGLLSGGYLVIRDDGGYDWSPASDFEAGYTLVEVAGAAGPATQAAREAGL